MSRHGRHPRSPCSRSSLSSRGVAVLADGAPAIPNETVVVHAVPRLDPAGVRALASAMLGKPPPDRWVDGLLAASSGLAGDAIALVGSIASEADPFAVDWSARTAATMVERRAQQLAETSPVGRTLVLACAVWG